MLLSEIKKIKSTTKELREFGFVVGGVLIAWAALSAWRHQEWPAWALLAGGALAVLGLVLPTALKPLQKIWMGLALLMGWVMSRVILTLLFFLVVTPIALILRAQGKQFLQKGGHAGDTTFWNLRGTELSDPKRCERQY